MSHFCRLLIAFSCMAATACGSGNSKSTDKPSISSSSSQTNSSSSEASLDLVEFIYPSYNANLMGSESTELIVKIKQSDELIGQVSGVQIGDLSLKLENGIWKTDASGLDLTQTTLNQSFDVFISDESGTLESKPLVLNTVSPSETSTSYVSGIGFDNDDKILFYSNAQAQSLHKVDKYSYYAEEVFSTGDSQQVGSANNFWSLTVDSAENQIYVAADYLANDLEENRVDLLNIEYDGQVTVYPSDSSLKSARSVVLDHHGDLAASLGVKAIYLLDYIATEGLQTWYLSGDFETLNNSTAGPTGDTETDFSGRFGPRAMLIYEDSLLVAREFSSSNKQGIGSITQVKFESDLFGSPVPSYKKFSNFNASGFQKPMAMAFNRDKTAIYVADVGRIWELDITGDSVDRPMRLVSSSNIIPSTLGTGPGLGNNISEMALHPDYDILYVAAGSQGLMAINLETGNRSSIAY